VGTLTEDVPGKIMVRMNYVFCPPGSLIRALLVAALLLSLAACGKKGPVRPLSEAAPVAPSTFTAVQTGESILLSWELPRVNQDGSPLVDLAGFRIERLGFERTDPCPECREDQAVLTAELDLDYLPAGSRQGEWLYWFDTRIAVGSGYLYRIYPTNRKERPGQPARLQLLTVQPPAAPPEISAAGHDRLVRLQWSAAPGLSPEAELVGYLVYRRRDNIPFAPVPLTPEPLSLTQHEDFSVENGITYYYSVRTVVRQNKQLVYSARSSEAVAIPVAGR
jgi:predicted small lipoprotein YifL